VWVPHRIKAQDMMSHVFCDVARQATNSLVRLHLRRPPGTECPGGRHRIILGSPPVVVLPQVISGVRLKNLVD
jgi:hypothetical protein